MKRELHALIQGAGIFITLLLFPTASEAMSYVSVKTMGRAGATVAQPVDTFVAAYNPAGSAFLRDRWDLGLIWAHEQGKTTFKGNSNFANNISLNSHDFCNLFIPEFGVKESTCECTMSWGFIVYNRGYLKTDYVSFNPILGSCPPGLEYIHEVASPTCSITFAKCHSLGVTLDFHGQRLKVNGLQNFANEDSSENPDNVTNKGYNYSGGIGVTVGWFSHLSECVTLGLAWSPEVSMSRFRDYKGLLASKGKFNVPQRFLGGVAVKFVPGLTGEFDMEHVGYNKIAALNHSLLPEFEESPFLGVSDGVGLGWRDQMIFRFGLEWEMNKCYSARIGYWYASTPIKSSETLANTLTPYIVEAYATLGGTWRSDRCNEMSFFVAYGFDHKIRGRNSIPDSLGGGEVDLHERKWLAGLSWGKYF